MTDQLDLFGARRVAPPVHATHPRHLSRRDDHESSHRAAERPLTSLELAERAGFDRYVVGRRLPELERDQAISMVGERQCRISGRLSKLWRAR